MTHPMMFLVILLIIYNHQTQGGTHLENTFKKLIKVDNTLVFLQEKGNKKCHPLLKLNNLRVVVNFEQKVRQSLGGLLKFVICANGYKNVYGLLNKFNSSSLWHRTSTPRGQFIIVSDEPNAKELSRIFLTFGITKVIQLKREVSIATRSPLISKCKRKFFKCRAHTPNPKYKILKNFVTVPRTRKMFLPSSVASYRNVDAYFKNVYIIFSETAKILSDSFKVRLQMSKGHNCNPFIQDYTTLCLKVESLVYNLHPKIEPSNPFFIDPLTWVIPRVQQANNKSMLFVFNWDASLMISVVFFLIVLKSWLVSRLLKEYSELRRVQTWMLFTAQLMVSVPCFTLPRSTSLRVMLIFYMYYCLLISNWFQARMTSVLIEPSNEPEFNTARELYASSMPLYAVGSHQGSIRAVYNDIYQQIKHKLTGKPFIDDTKDRLEYCIKHGCAILMNPNLLQYYLAHLNSKCYALKYENIFTSTHSFYLPSGDYRMEKVNRVIAIMFESGFYEKIFQGIKEKYSKKPLIVDVEEGIYLKLTHLKEVFVLLFVCLSIAFIVLIAELAYYHLYAKKRSQG